MYLIPRDFVCVGAYSQRSREPSLRKELQHQEGSGETEN